MHFQENQKQDKKPLLIKRLLYKLKIFYFDLIVFTANSLISHTPNHRFRLFFYRRFMRWQIGHSTSIHRGCRNLGFPRPGAVRIGNHTCIGQNFYLGGAGYKNMQIEIGNNVNIAMDVFITLGGHELDTRKNFELTGKPVVIEDHAVIFARAMIIVANIGRGAVVLPGSVVVKDVEPFTIVGGNPAKIVGKREPQQDPEYRLNWRWRFH